MLRTRSSHVCHVIIQLSLLVCLHAERSDTFCLRPSLSASLLTIQPKLVENYADSIARPNMAFGFGNRASHQDIIDISDNEYHILQLLSLVHNADKKYSFSDVDVKDEATDDPTLIEDDDDDIIVRDLSPSALQDLHADRSSHKHLASITTSRGIRLLPGTTVELDNHFFFWIKFIDQNAYGKPTLRGAVLKRNRQVEHKISHIIGDALHAMLPMRKNEVCMMLKAEEGKRGTPHNDNCLVSIDLEKALCVRDVNLHQPSLPSLQLSRDQSARFRRRIRSSRRDSSSGMQAQVR